MINNYAWFFFFQSESDDITLACCSAIKDILSHFITSTKYVDSKTLESEKLNHEKGREKSKYFIIIFMSKWKSLYLISLCLIKFKYAPKQVAILMSHLMCLLLARGKLLVNNKALWSSMRMLLLYTVKIVYISHSQDLGKMAVINSWLLYTSFIIFGGLVYWK